jgi:hypothetical protein
MPNQGETLFYMNTRKAADYLGLWMALLEHWRHLGLGPKFMRVGRRILYRRDDLDAFMAQHLVTPPLSGTMFRTAWGRS